MRNRWLAPAGLAAAALVVAACGSSSSSGGSGGGSGNSPAAAPAAGNGTTLEAKEVSGAKLLTNAKGFTLYWFVPDTATQSKCNGSCAKYWPPVKRVDNVYGDRNLICTCGTVESYAETTPPS